ncbi:MAG: hypothetical protein NTX72_01520 [Candidatus Uhrbacteria bacterium]|nr:hypothetical protein [Candidatus Uhrbacteria bacterium]
MHVKFTPVDDALPIPTVREEHVGGFVLEYSVNNVIAAIRQGERRIRCGQVVTANGRFGAQEGARGVVRKILKPNTHGTTSNVLDVHFAREDTRHTLKFKDLLW